MSAAIYLDEGEIKKERYSAIGELVDFATLHSWREGTSFSSPVLARMMADIMSKYGFIEQDKMYEILKSLVIDAGEEGHDPRFGHGVPVLPENCTISILENPSPIKPPSPELPELDPVQPPVKPPTPIELPGEEYNEGSEEMPYMYLVRYSHLDKILVKPGAHLKPAIAWGGKVSPATKIGLQGDTGLSTGNHLLISVVKVPFDKNFKYVKYSQEDMYKGAPEPSKEQLDLFVDETLFEGPYKITVGFNDPKYYSEHGRHHPSYCVVPLADNTIYWNRSFAGRVIATGYDNSYGKYVVAAYSTLEFDSYREENTTTPPEPIDPINVGNVNDVSKTWINSAGGYLYQMTNKNSKKTQYGQTTNFDGKVRYIEVHPNNMGIVDAFTTIERTGYSGINGTFFWYDDDSRRTTTSTSILKIKDKILQENANHLPYPQGVFCYYRDGTFGIEKVKNVKNLSKPTWWAIGGIEMVKDNMVTYNSSAEGFIGKFADVHRKTNRSAIGINKEGNILLVRSWQSTAAETAVQMRELGCIYAIGLDGGGSTQYATPGPKRLSSREVDHLFVAADLKL